MGKLKEALGRNIDGVNSERVDALYDVIEKKYKRIIEDTKDEIKSIEMDLKSNIDFNIDSGNIIALKDFDVSGFINKDISLTLELHKNNMILKEVESRYEALIGK